MIPEYVTKTNGMPKTQYKSPILSTDPKSRNAVTTTQSETQKRKASDLIVHS